jgi:hypothetical protein
MTQTAGRANQAGKRARAYALWIAGSGTRQLSGAGEPGRRAPTSRHVAEKRDAEGVCAFRGHRAEGGHLEHAAHRPDLGFAHLGHAMKDQLDGLLIERSNGDRAPGNPPVLISRRQLLRETVLDADDHLVQRCGQHRSK